MVAWVILLAACGARQTSTVLSPVGDKGVGRQMQSQSQGPLSVSGLVTRIKSSTNFVFQTGSPHGLVPVSYTQSQVAPAGNSISVSQNVTVQGAFDSQGHLAASAVTIDPISGTVTTVKSSTEFVYQTGAPRALVPVNYSESVVIPAGKTISVGQTVSVIGEFDAKGHLSATNVSISGVTGPGPYHIATWANDLYFSEGSLANPAQVSKYVSYAESGLNNSKALDDCKSFPGTCKSVYYFDPSDVYFSTTCPYAPDAAIIAAASENWFVHQQGYTDSAHRVNGVMHQNCNGTTLQIPIWTTNDGSASVQAWWNAELQNNADGFDLGFMDDTQSRVVDQYYYRSGGGCLPWPSLCSTTQEVTDDASVRAGHVSFVNAMTHRNGQPWKFAFNSLNFDGQQVSVSVQLLTATSRFVAGVCEGCAISNGRIEAQNYSRILDTMNAVNATPGAFILHSTDRAPNGSSTEISERLITTGLVWLGYSEGHTIAWPDLEDSSQSLAVWPEDLLYPSDPIQTMGSGSNDLQVIPGVWRREFRSCYQAGVPLGPCAALVNSTSNGVVVQASWLTQAYGHIVSLTGGDIISGGSASVSSAAFQPGTTAIPASGALLLAN
jgi:hypothetical protein